MPKYDFKRIADLGGGVREDADSTKLPDGTWLSLQNFEYQIDGRLSARGGSAKYNATAITSATSIDQMIRFYRPSTAAKLLVVAANNATNNKLYYGTDANGTFTEITGGTALTANKPGNYAVFRDYLLYSNGYQKIQYYQAGATKADCTYSDNSRVGKYLAIADWRVHVAGDPSAPNRLYISEFGFFVTSPGADASFPSNNYVDIPKEDRGDFTTGLAEKNGQVFVFRNKDVFYLSGEDFTNWALQPCFDASGAIDQKGICVTPYGMLFVGADQIWWWKDPPNGQATPIGDFVKATFNSHVWTGVACGYYPKNNQIWVSFAATAGAANTETFVWDCLLEKWVGPHTVAGNCYVNFSGAGDTEAFYYGSTTAGTVVQLDTGNQDITVNYACIASSKHYNFDNPEDQKLFRRLVVECCGGTDTDVFSVQAIIDRGVRRYSLGDVDLSGFLHYGELVYGVDYYGGGEFSKGMLSFPHGVKGQEIQLVITKTGNYALDIFTIGCQYMNLPARWRVT